MKHWKTTLGAIVAAAGIVMGHLGWTDQTLTTSLATIGTLILGFFARDNSNTK